MSPHTAEAPQGRRVQNHRDESRASGGRRRRRLELPTVTRSVAASRLLSRLGFSERHPPVERKPLMRGWIHAAFTPVVFVLGLIAGVLAKWLLPGTWYIVLGAMAGSAVGAWRTAR